MATDIEISKISPDEDLTKIAAVQIAAFDPAGILKRILEPEPRPSMQVRWQRTAARMRRMFASTPAKEASYIGFKAANPHGDIVGIMYWRKPGYGPKLANAETMSEEEFESYQGLNNEMYNNYKVEAQAGQDRWLAEKGDKHGAWYLEVLAIDPKAQGQRVGARLLDHSLSVIDAPQAEYAGCPCWLEPSKAGQKLYESRGFDTVPFKMHSKGLEEVAPDGFTAQYRSPAQARPT